MPPRATLGRLCLTSTAALGLLCRPTYGGGYGFRQAIPSPGMHIHTSRGPQSDECQRCRRAGLYALHALLQGPTATLIAQSSDPASAEAASAKGIPGLSSIR